jgi:3-polyprenyl-4-hydroxybenzoate decarboxylase
MTILYAGNAMMGSTYIATQQHLMEKQYITQLVSKIVQLRITDTSMTQFMVFVRIVVKAVHHAKQSMDAIHAYLIIKLLLIYNINISMNYI